MNPLEKIKELSTQKHEVFLSTSEIAMLSAALGGLGASITDRMNGAEPEEVTVLARMLADSKKLENRLDTLLRSVVGGALGEIADLFTSGDKEGDQ